MKTMAGIKRPKINVWLIFFLKQSNAGNATLDCSNNLDWRLSSVQQPYNANTVPDDDRSESLIFNPDIAALNYLQ